MADAGVTAEPGEPGGQGRVEGRGLRDRWRGAVAWCARPEVALWAILGGAFVARYVSVLRTKPLFAPDSQYYVGMSLRFSGLSRAEAYERAIRVPLENGWTPTTQEAMFGWDLVTPRVVLPLLSAPFTRAFGPYGMAVVTAVATFGMVALVLVVARRRYGLAAALVPVFLVLASSYLMFYGSALLTESLTAVWSACVLLAVWWYQRTGLRRALVLAASLTVVFAFTRQATFIVAGAVVVAWLAALVLRQDHRRWRAPALVVGGTALGTQLLQMVLFPGFSQVNQFLAKTGTDSLAEALAAAPRLAWRIFRRDMENFMLADRALLVLIGLSAIAVVLRWRDSSSHLLIGAFAGIVLYNVTNGTPTAFRYAMPGLVFYVLAVAGLISLALPRSLRAAPEPPDGSPAATPPETVASPALPGRPTA